MSRTRLRFLVALVSASLLAASPAPARRPGQPVRIANQQILVGWDPETRMEHFIRAEFAAGTRQEGFGGLVPSPTVPEIAAAGLGLLVAVRRRASP